jgi:transcriptional regulator with XRE-family HTH domain
MKGAKRLKALRIKARLTRKQLADIAGISLATVDEYEKSMLLRPLTPGAVLKLAAALGVDAQAFADCVVPERLSRWERALLLAFDSAAQLSLPDYFETAFRRRLDSSERTALHKAAMQLEARGYCTTDPQRGRRTRLALVVYRKRPSTIASKE